MGREIKRVPLDFDAPLGETWAGYVGPEIEECPDCRGHGETAARRYVSCIAHLLMIVGENGLTGQKHPWLGTIPLAPTEPPGLDAAELSTGLAGRAPAGHFGHDGIDRWKATGKIIEAAGLNPDTWGICPACQGHGETPESYARGEAFERQEPPEGEGWQVWETVSDGSPITQVFATAEDLVEHLTAFGDGWTGPYSRQAAERFVETYWAPSMIATGGQVYSGIEGLTK